MEAQKNPTRNVDSYWTYPERPWSQVHIDFACHINGLSCLVVVDAHSKWPEIFPIKQTLVQQLQSSDDYLVNGLPKTLGYNLHGRCFVTSASHAVSHASGHHLITHNPKVKLNILWTHLNVFYWKKGKMEQRQSRHCTRFSFLTDQHQMKQQRHSWFESSVLHWTHYGPNNITTQTKKEGNTFPVSTPMFVRNYSSGQQN